MTDAFAVEPQIVNRSAVVYAAVRDQLHRDRLADAVPRMVGEVAEFLQRQRVAPVGPPLIRYLMVDYNSGVADGDCDSACRVIFR